VRVIEKMPVSTDARAKSGLKQHITSKPRARIRRVSTDARAKSGLKPSSSSPWTDHKWLSSQPMPALSRD